MFGLEFLLLIVVSFEPALIGLLVFIGLGREVGINNILKLIYSSRASSTPYRFYECASYSRLAPVVVYSLPFILVLLAYLIYDVDFILLVSESSLASTFGLYETGVLICYIYFFGLGLLIDYVVSGYA